MKIEVHVPVEQYGFALAHGDSGMEDTGTFARRVYDNIKDAFAAKPSSLPDKEMTDFIHDMLHGKKYHIETWERMNPAQKVFINQLKKAQQRNPPKV